MPHKSLFIEFNNSNSKKVYKQSLINIRYYLKILKFNKF